VDNVLQKNTVTNSGGTRERNRRSNIGWRKAALLAGLWLAAECVVLFPALYLQGDLFTRQDWRVPGFSTAELLQTELSMITLISACLLGRHYRSWKFVCFFVGLSVIAVYAFALSLFAPPVQSPA
jgi:hypothetical protein